MNERILRILRSRHKYVAIFYTSLGGVAYTRDLERVEVECGHDAEVGHVLCQSLRCARDFEKHKNILMKL